MSEQFSKSGRFWIAAWAGEKGGCTHSSQLLLPLPFPYIRWYTRDWKMGSFSLINASQIFMCTRGFVYKEISELYGRSIYGLKLGARIYQLAQWYWSRWSEEIQSHSSPPILWLNPTTNKGIFSLYVETSLWYEFSLEQELFFYLFGNSIIRLLQA